MKNEKKCSEKPEGQSSCLMVALILSAVIMELMLFSRFFPYPATKVLILLLLQPLVLNLLLLIPRKNWNLPSTPTAVPENPEDIQENAKKFGKLIQIRQKIHSLMQPVVEKLLDFLTKHQILCVSVLSGVFLLVTNLRFWKQWIPFFQHPVSVLIPIVFAVSFFVLLVLEIWCRHLKREFSDPDCRCACILNNLHSTIRIVKFLFLAAAVVVAMPKMGMWSVYHQFYYVLCGFYAAQTTILVLFYGIRAAKRELESHPDLRLLVFGRKKGDLNLLGYLEENTGITMRSLWSISLVKQLFPYMILLGALILWLSTGIVQIAPNQSGALYRLGKLSPHCLQPGIHMTLPWPIDSVDVYDTQSLKEITIGYTTDQEKGDNLWTENHGGDESKLLLGGGNELVSINLRIEYKISDLYSYLKCSNSPASLLESAAYEAVTAKTISTNLETLLAVDRVAFSKSFEQELTERISHYHTGLQVVDVVIESIHPPVEVADIYQQIISAGIDAEKILLDAQAKAATVLEEAKTNHDTEINTATAKSYADIAKAKASVSEFMASLEADEAYGSDYRYYKYLDALRKAYSNARLVIVSEGVDNSHLYLGNLPS